MIARAIVGDASVILADEPTAALDSENGHAVMTVLAEIAKDPARALFIVTHDPRIMPFADRILRIEDGRIVSDQPGGGDIRAVRALKYASGLEIGCLLKTGKYYCSVRLLDLRSFRRSQYSRRNFAPMECTQLLPVRRFRNPGSGDARMRRAAIG